MANSCATDLNVQSYDRETIENLYGLFTQLLNTKRTCTVNGEIRDGHPHWLGYVVTDILHKEVEEIPCRGTFSLTSEVTQRPNGAYSFSMFTESAWCATDKLFVELAKMYNLKILYLEIEPGCQIFYTNDYNGEVFPERYILDSDIEGEEYFCTFDELAKRIEEITGILPSEYDEIEQISDLYDGEFLSVNQIELQDW